MISNWSQVLVARDITAGVTQSFRYNPLTAEFYHANFDARQLGLGKQIPVPYESVARSLKQNKLSVADHGKIT